VLSGVIDGRQRRHGDHRLRAEPDGGLDGLAEVAVAAPDGRFSTPVTTAAAKLRISKTGGPKKNRSRDAAGRRYVDPDIAASALTEDDCPLTDRELEVLRASWTGASIGEIAQQVHLAPGTVRNYLSAAMAKLGVSSRHAAAHRAWEEGWI
jgi:DNA-binding NarL/FixJ family response regulator